MRIIRQEVLQMSYANEMFDLISKAIVAVGDVPIIRSMFHLFVKSALMVCGCCLL